VKGQKMVMEWGAAPFVTFVLYRLSDLCDKLANWQNPQVGNVFSFSGFAAIEILKHHSISV